MTTASQKAAIEAERLRLWRKKVRAHPRMTPTTAEILEKEIEEQLKAYIKTLGKTGPAQRPRQISFDFLREHPIGYRFKISKRAR